MLAPLPNDNELLELVFAQSIAGFFVMLLESLTNVAAPRRRGTGGDPVHRRRTAPSAPGRGRWCRGITPSELTDSRSLGLLGMRERAAAEGGSLRIEPVRGGGTALVLEMPRSMEDS